MLCRQCQQWLENVLRQLSDLTDGFKNFKSDKIVTQDCYDFSRLHEWRPLCWLCSQIKEAILIRNPETARVYHQEARFDGSIGIVLPHQLREKLGDPSNVALELRYHNDASEPSNATVHVPGLWSAAWLDLSSQKQSEGLPAHSTGVYRFEAVSGDQVSPALISVRNVDRMGIRKAEAFKAFNGTVPHTLTLDRINQIKHWLDTCDSSHPCMAIATSSDAERKYLPKRLLKFSNSSSTVQLIYPACHESKERLLYATLSHCWGQSQFLKLTRSNHDRLVQGFPLEDLGLTFLEAVLLCQSLELDHLWVDSMCIIQDDPDDWLEEAPKMQQIYGGSYLNIAATSSQNCDQGLLRALAPKFCYLTVELSGDVALIGRPQFWSYNLLKGHLYGAPLFARGWVLQELFLSPRNLHMTYGGLQWQCKCLQEREPVAKRHAALSSAIETWSDLTTSHVDFANSSQELDKMWTAVTHAYSRTVTTFIEDRYWALSGLAALFKQRYSRFGVHTQYIAGHWQHDLARSLVWAPTTRGATRLEMKDRELCLPSWSCLAMSSSDEGAVNQSSVQKTIHYTDVEHVQQTWGARTSEFGPPASISLTLKAALFTVELCKSCPSEWIEDSICEEFMPVKIRDRNGAEFTLPGEECTAEFRLESSPADSWKTLHDCIFVCACINPYITRFFMLVLQGTSRRDDGVKQYMRCGRIVIDQDGYDGSALEQFLEYLEDSGRQTEEFYLV